MSNGILTSAESLPQKNTCACLLAAENACAWYGNVQVLRNISFTVKRGCVTALLGANGSGKSTLLRLLAGIRHPQLKTGGRVFACGKDVGDLPRREAARLIAYTAQSEIPAWQYTVRQMVLMGRYAHSNWNYSRSDEAVADEKIALMELDGLAERSVMALSGGEFQRAVVARALAQEASILLLDEPVSSLDIRHQHQLMTLARRIVHSRNLGAVISLHDINLAALFADRILVLHDGMRIACGTPEAVIKSDILHQAYGIRFGLYRHPKKNLPQVYAEDL